MTKWRVTSVCTDKRGHIYDVFYKHPIEHVAVIDTRAGHMRGNHYHLKTVHHILVTMGAMEYWWIPVGTDGPALCELICSGEVVTTPPEEIHALVMHGPNQFVVFSEGVRGGQDYESDTYRVSCIVPPTRLPEMAR